MQLDGLRSLTSRSPVGLFKDYRNVKLLCLSSPLSVKPLESLSTIGATAWHDGFQGVLPSVGDAKKVSGLNDPRAELSPTVQRALSPCAKLDHGVLRGLLSFKLDRKLEADSHSNSVPEEIEEHMIGFDMLNRGPCLEHFRTSHVYGSVALFASFAPTRSAFF